MAPFRLPKQNNRTQLHHMASKGDLYKLRAMLDESDLVLGDARKFRGLKAFMFKCSFQALILL